MDPIETLAAHVVALSPGDLPPAATTAVKTFLLDSIGVGIAGGGEPVSVTVLDTARGWGTGAEAAVWGTGVRLPAPAAALVNAHRTHGLEYDCVHEGAVVHVMATLAAALLAEVERRGGASGPDVIAAVAAGVDVAASIGLAARGAMRFFRPATAGTFGAVAALGKLAGLDAGTLTSAFGLAYGQISGTLQPHVEGSPLLALQIGFAARAAVTSVDLARAGVSGPREVLEGRYGYFRLFEGGAYDVKPALGDLGRVWRVAELAHKPFPSGRLTHGVVDGLLTLQAAHGFAAADVTRVVARVPPLVLRLVARPDVPAPAPSYARLCLPFVAATALLQGGVDVPDFRGDRLTDPRTHALAARVEVASDGNPDENALVPQVVTVELAGGRHHEIRLDQVLGHPDRPLSRAQHLDKFRRCWGYGATSLPREAGERLIELVDRLDTVEDARALVACTIPSTGGVVR